MKRIITALAVLLVVGACGGDPFADPAVRDALAKAEAARDEAVADAAKAEAVQAEWEATSTTSTPTTSTSVPVRVSGLDPGEFAVLGCRKWRDQASVDDLRLMVQEAGYGFDWGARDGNTDGYPCDRPDQIGSGYLPRSFFAAPAEGGADVEVDPCLEHLMADLAAGDAALSRSYRNCSDLDFSTALRASAITLWEVGAEGPDGRPLADECEMISLLRSAAPFSAQKLKNRLFDIWWECSES